MNRTTPHQNVPKERRRRLLSSNTAPARDERDDVSHLIFERDTAPNRSVEARVKKWWEDREIDDDDVFAAALSRKIRIGMGSCEFDMLSSRRGGGY